MLGSMSRMFLFMVSPHVLMFSVMFSVMAASMVAAGTARVPMTTSMAMTAMTAMTAVTTF